MSNEHNADELEAPAWLNAEFFTKVLRSSERDETIVVKKIEITPASLKGDHYASIMFRALVDYQQGKAVKQMSTVTKMMPEVEGMKMNLLKETTIFETEITMYEQVIPKFEAILKAAGDETSLGARCLYSTLKPRKVIVFEDLVPKGYIVIRDRQIKACEIKMALTKLAKWHAVGLKVSTDEPDYVANFNRGIFTLHEFYENPMMSEGMGQFVDMLSATPALQQYESHFRGIPANILETCSHYGQEYFNNRRPGTTYVLSHGDFHLKNMMFREQPLDVKLLDFQISSMGPIAMDLLYAIFMLATPEQRLNHRDELIYHYYTEFVKTLKVIGYAGDIPKLRDLRAQIFQYRYFEFFLLVTFLPAFYAILLEKGDPDKLFSSRDERKLMYQHAGYIKEMETLLPHYVHLGYFEE